MKLASGTSVLADAVRVAAHTCKPCALGEVSAYSKSPQGRGWIKASERGLGLEGKAVRAASRHRPATITSCEGLKGNSPVLQCPGAPRIALLQRKAANKAPFMPQRSAHSGDIS